MKFVLETSIIENWYIPNKITSKGLGVRIDLLKGLHELIAPELFLVEAAQILLRAEKAGVISSGKMQDELTDLETLGVAFFPTIPLLRRASEIGLSTKLKVVPSLYIALAEREQCQVLTADPKFLRVARKQFPFVMDLASLP